MTEGAAGRLVSRCDRHAQPSRPLNGGLRNDVSIKLFTSTQSPDVSPFFMAVFPPPPVSPLACYSTFLISFEHLVTSRAFISVSLYLYQA